MKCSIGRGRSPVQLGYRWPAEWSRHRATWLAWPHNRETWPSRFGAVAPLTARLVQLLAEREEVRILAGGAAVMADARRWVGRRRNVTLHDVETNDAWIRDFGPTFLAGPPEAPPALIDWRYNAWGGQYPPFDKDNAAGRAIARRLGRRRFAPRMVLEGGQIDGNGLGLLLANQDCLLDPRRNPGMTLDQVQRRLKRYLGADAVLWLRGPGIAGDDTGGHVDQMARFVGPATIVAAIEDDPRDENYGVLRENRRRLASMTAPGGRPLEIVPLPMPRPVWRRGSRLPASYCNFYIANGIVIAPQFDDPADRKAIRTLQQLFPDRRVCGLPAGDLIEGRGAFHCMTQQEPA